MKEILIVSGKGGTGKTTITAAFASITKDVVLADCDVDAADLHLIMHPNINETRDFFSGHEAKIKQSSCTQCGKCDEVCRFEAVNKKDSGGFIIDSFACEGCGVCVWSCPSKAIEFSESLCGQIYVSNTRFGQMVHAKLEVAAENSGKLVSQVRIEAKKIAEDNNNSLILIDGPPGIGCPVIASMTGVDAVVIITEATLSGLHDMERVIGLANHFSIDIYVCINKSDINIDIKNKIKKMLKEKNISLIGEIPYDKEITQAQINGKTVIEYSNSDTAKKIKNMWNLLIENLK